MTLLRDPKYLERAVGLVKQAQSARDLLGTTGMKPKDLTAAMKTHISGLMKGGDDHENDHLKTEKVCQNVRGTEALRKVGVTIVSGAGEPLAPTTLRRNYTDSRAEMMQIIVYKIKEAYFPREVNVATWDAALNLDVARCCGLEECGTAENESGLEYRFAVFRGVGQIKWTGGIPRGGIPDVSCSGNFSLGNDSSVWFENTDRFPSHIVSDLIELTAR